MKRPFALVAVAIAVAIALAIRLIAAAAVPVPEYAAVRASYQSSDVRLLDRHGEPIDRLRVDADGRRLEWVTLDRISPVLQRAVIEAEDRRFYEHRGVDWIALAGALRHDLFAGARRGASTLTMQLAARLDPSLNGPGGRRDPVRKWRQMRAAWSLERHWTKSDILEAYLNLVGFRGELQGVDAASRGLFDRAPAGIDAAQASILAALLRAPNADQSAVAQRACRLLRATTAASSCQPVEALSNSMAGVPSRIRPEVALAPQVARRLIRPQAALERPAGGDNRVLARRDHAPVQPATRDRDVRSTLDAGLQRYAIEALQHQLGLLADSEVRDGAVLAVDNRTGEVLVYVGNAGAGASAMAVDGVQAPRQAGSTLKPFLYVLAIEQRLLTAASLLEDAPVNLATPTGLYVPQDYDKDFHGLVSARTALASSLNVPAVRTLMLVGVDAYADRLRKLGFAGITEPGDYYGFSLALGSAEVTLWQLVDAYRALANGGVYGDLTLRPRSPAPAQAERIMDAGAVFVVSDILADRSARSITFGLDSPLATPFWSAVKTGTSKDMRDNWCVGFSRDFTVGVWVGNFDGAPMRDVSGISGAAPVWLELMRRLHGAAPEAPPVAPSGVVAGSVHFEPPIEPPRREWFLAGTQTDRVRLDRGPSLAARIVYPGDEMIIAFDPDIPADRERVFFRMAPAVAGLRWRLDGGLVPAPGEGWQPRGGRHALELIDAGGRVLDTVHFRVRGGPPGA